MSKNNPRARLKIFRLVLVFALVAIFLRVTQVQFFYGDRLAKMARSQEREIELQGPRGKIRDRQGRELASSVESLSFFADPNEIENFKSFAQKAGALLGIPPADLYAKLKQNENKRFIWLKRQVEPKIRARFESSKNESLQGMGVLHEYRREYPHGDLMSQLIGRVSVDGEGIEGIERDFEKTLKAGTSVVRVPRDARGRLFYVDKNQLLSKGVAGKDVYLSIDLSLQSLVESKVDEYRRKYQADSALAIVVDPLTNEILVWAQNPRIYQKDGRPFRNFAATDPIEPGSVVKPLLLSWALERNIVHEKTIFDIPGGTIKIFDKTFKDPGKTIHTRLTPEEILKYSSNVGAIRLGQRMGFRDLWTMYEKMGFTQKSQLPLASESRSIIKKPRETQLVEQATMAFGQGYAITPLQLLRGFQVIAGDGYLRPLKIIQDSKHDSATEELKDEKVLSPKTLARIRKLMQASLMDGGTAVHARVEGYTVAGKTGTSQKINRVDSKAKGYKVESFWTSFVGFLPSEEPRYLMYVAFDYPKQGGNSGGQTAAPLFAEIAKICLRGDTSLPPSLAVDPAKVTINPKLADIQETSLDQSLEDLSVKNTQEAAQQQALSEESALKANIVPNVVGLHVSEALVRVQAYDYSLRVKGRGHYVAHQYPEPGAILKKNKQFVLFLK